MRGGGGACGGGARGPPYGREASFLWRVPGPPPGLSFPACTPARRIPAGLPRGRPRGRRGARTLLVAFYRAGAPQLADWGTSACGGGELVGGGCCWSPGARCGCTGPPHPTAHHPFSEAEEPSLLPWLPAVTCSSSSPEEELGSAGRGVGGAPLTRPIAPSHSAF